MIEFVDPDLGLEPRAQVLDVLGEPDLLAGAEGEFHLPHRRAHLLALAEHPRSFAEFYRAAVSAGEAAGRIVEAPDGHIVSLAGRELLCLDTSTQDSEP